MKHTVLEVRAYQHICLAYGAMLNNVKLNPGQANEYTGYIREFLAFLEGQGLCDYKSINQTVVDEYMLHLSTRKNFRKDKRIGIESVKKHSYALKSFLKYLKKEHHFTTAVKLKQIKGIKIKVTRVLTKPEIKQLYAVTDNTYLGIRDRAMLAVFLGAGLRKKEGINLRISDINLHNNTIYVRHPKNNTQRIVNFDNVSREHLEDYLRVRKLRINVIDKGHLFISERKRKVSPETFAKRMEVLTQRARLKNSDFPNATLHLLRHTLGTHLYLNSKNIYLVKESLGHKSIESCQHYIHLAHLLENGGF